MADLGYVRKQRMENYKELSQSLTGTVCIKKRLVVLGDRYCGKTTLLVEYRHNSKLTTGKLCHYGKVTIKVNETPVELVLIKTRYELDSYRCNDLVYRNADVFVVCFAIDDPTSFENVSKKWIPELRLFCPDVPVILVGNKKDLRHNTDVVECLKQRHLEPISAQDGQSLAERMNISAFLECSAQMKEGVREVFETALMASLHINHTNRHIVCNLL